MPMQISSCVITTAKPIFWPNYWRPSGGSGAIRPASALEVGLINLLMVTPDRGLWFHSKEILQ